MIQMCVGVGEYEVLVCVAIFENSFIYGTFSTMNLNYNKIDNFYYWK